MRFRSFQVLLVLLLVCAPVMAATIDVVGGGDGTVTVTITADGAANIVAAALDIDVDGGAVVTAVSIDTPNFNIFPDAGYTLGAGYTYGAGTPAADKFAPGGISLPQSSFALSFGNLNGSATAGANGAASVQITITIDSMATICVSENALRGGIVAVDGTELDAAQDCGDAGPCPCECVNSSAVFYADWVAFGTPDCWCYARNCKGDADGLLQGSLKTGYLAVSTNDLTVLANAWQIKEPPAGPGVDSIGICADFDRAAQGSAKTGYLRVSTNDLTILANNWQIKEPSAGPGIGDCTGPDYIFLY